MPQHRGGPFEPKNLDASAEFRPRIQRPDTRARFGRFWRFFKQVPSTSPSRAAVQQRVEERADTEEKAVRLVRLDVIPANAGIHRDEGDPPGSRRSPG